MKALLMVFKWVQTVAKLVEQVAGEGIHPKWTASVLLQICYHLKKTYAGYDSITEHEECLLDCTQGKIEVGQMCYCIERQGVMRWTGRTRHLCHCFVCLTVIPILHLPKDENKYTGSSTYDLCHLRPQKLNFFVVIPFYLQSVPVK
jgi:hypothetical protein